MKSRYLSSALVLSLGLFYGCGSDDDSTPAAAAPNVSVTGGSATPFLPNALMGTTGGGTPASFKVVVTKVWLSQNADCSSPVLVKDVSDTADYEDWLSTPTLLTGSVTAGTYNCLILEMLDTLIFTTPAVITNAGTHVNCAANTTYGMDIFRDPGETWYHLSDAATITAAGDMSDSNLVTNTAQAEAYVATGGGQLVTIFASTGTGADVKAAYPTFHENGGQYYQFLSMTGAIVVPASGSKTIALKYNFDNLLSGDGADGADPLCWVEGPTLSVE